MVNGNPTDNYSVNLQGGSINLLSSNLGNLNAAGFNPLDGRLYARSTNPPSGGNNDLSIYAIGAGGTFTVYGFPIPGMPATQAGNVGDVDGDGYLHITGQGGANAVAVVDVTPTRPTFMTVVRTYTRTFGTGLGNANLGVDMAYRASDNLFYSVRSGTNPQLVTMNPSTGEVLLVGTVNGLTITAGAQFMTSNGQLLAIDNTSGLMYRVDLTDPALPHYPAGDTGLPNMTNNDGASCPQTPFQPAGIGGRVFEDLNYGGGAGRNFVASAGSARPGARVELYNSTGSFVSFTTTDANGEYNFADLTPGNYTVRVVNSTVTSSRTGSIASLRGVQTFRSDASTGVAVGDVDRVGGEIPSLIDAANGSTTLGALTTATTTAQSISPVTLGSTAITGVDFGFNFNTIVNVNNAGQGSLRQFIVNSNNLSPAGLAIEGQPADRCVSIFMISDGSARPGIRAGLANLLTAGVAQISITSRFDVTGSFVSVDATTQTANIGNTNPGAEGVAGIVGTGAGAGTINQIPRPEVEVIFNNAATNNNIFRVSGTDNHIRGLALRKSGSGAGFLDALVFLATASRSLAESNFVGISATGPVDPGPNNRVRNGIWFVENDGSLARNNYVSFSDAFGVYVQSASNVLIVGNNVQAAGLTSPASNPQEPVRIFGDGPTTVRHNYLGSTQFGNIEMGQSSNVTVTGNTIENGMQTPIGAIVPAQNAAVVAMAAQDVTISHNIIRNTQNDGHGVLVNSRAGLNGIRVRITQNSIYDNALLGINVNISNVDEDSTNDQVTPNDGIKDPNTANSGMDYPIVSAAALSGSNLIIQGFIGTSAAGNPSFANATIEIFKAADDGTNNGPVILGDGLSRPHGEGERYLATITSDANGRFGAVVPVTGLAFGDAMTLTATDSDGNTSEFGVNYTLLGPTAASGEIGGHVRDLNGVGVNRVAVRLIDLSNGNSKLVLTDRTGQFLFTGNQIGGVFLVKPESNGTGAIFPTNHLVSLSESAYGIEFTASGVRSLQHQPFNDFDGDGKFDAAVFREDEGNWYIRQSSDSSTKVVKWGMVGDKPVAADYDGDGVTDLAVFRAGQWFILRSSDGQVHILNYGLPGDLPTVADYDGDGIADLSVFRPSDNTWHWLESGNDFRPRGAQWGINGDIPSPEDFDGDGRADLAVYRPSTGVWYIVNSADQSVTIHNLGSVGDVPVASDYDGDGRADIAVYHPIAGSWRSISTVTNTLRSIQIGGNTGDRFLMGDTNKDGKMDKIVFSSGIWLINESSTRRNQGLVYSFEFGLASDIPIALR